MLAAAADALVDEAKKHGTTIKPPELRVGSDSTETVAALDQAIATAADAAHASSTDFAYAAIRAMAGSLGDRYTQFFTPDELKKFNDALDPERISGIGVMIGTDAPTSQINLTYVVPGTPADKAGLQAGDVLTSIAGTSTKVCRSLTPALYCAAKADRPSSFASFATAEPKRRIRSNGPKFSRRRSSSACCPATSVTSTLWRSAKRRPRNSIPPFYV